MKYMVKLFFLIICLTTVAAPQIKNKSIDDYINKTSFSKNKFQPFENYSIHDIDNELKKFHFSIKKNKLSKDNSTFFQPVKVTCDTTRETYTYDKYGNTLSHLMEVLKGGVWENSIRYSYIFENAGKDQGRIQEVWKNGKWENVDRYNIKNDDSGNCLMESHEVWNDSTGSWLNIDRYSFTYNNSGLPVTELSEIWVDSVWVTEDKFSYKYDNSNNIIERLAERWLNDTWNSYVKYNYVYDNSGNLLTTSMERIFDGTWTIIMQFSFNYDNFKRPVSRIFQRRNEEGELVNYEKDSLSYDTNGNILVEIYQDFAGTTWVNSSKISSIYDNNSNLISQVDENWADSTWVNMDRDLYTFDNSGNVISHTSQTWSDDSWQNMYKTILNYDNFGNGIHGENYQWQDSSWITCVNDFYLRYNNNKDEIYIYSSKGDVEYAEFPVTGVDEKKLEIIEYNLTQNYPNPFNPSTRITYSLPKESFVTLKVYNSLGEEITTLVNEAKPAGKYMVEFNGSDLSSGVYFYKLIAGEFSSTKKFVLLR